MIHDNDPLIAMRSMQNTSKLEEMSKPMHRVLSDLIARCSPNQSSSTMATAGLVLSLWQLQGTGMSEHVPSLVFLNAGEAAPDPIDEFTKDLVYDDKTTRPSMEGQTLGIPIEPKEGPKIMQRAMQKRQQLGYQGHLDFLSKRNARIHEDRYQQASKSAYGIGYSRAYSRAWTDTFGLLTEDNDQVILRLNEAPDRAAFRDHLLKEPVRLLRPEGIGRLLQPVRKHLSISGSLAVDLWDEELVSGIIKLGLPVVFLPHKAKEPLTIPNLPALKILPGLWRNAPGRSKKTPLQLPPVDWFKFHTAEIRRRLHLLPGCGDYEFAILQLLRQLGSVCNQIAHYSANNTEATGKQLSALFWDLHTRTFRGITLGVVSLAWHCLGFDPGCPRGKALKVLKFIRQKKTVKKSELLLAKGCRVNAPTRDALLERFAAEDLIRVEGKTITATTFEEFVEALHSRPELPEAASFGKLVEEDERASK